MARSRPGACAETFKAAETGFPLGIDLATIERFTLDLIAQQFVGGVQLGETGRRFGIVLVGVGMQFFCEPAVGVFDLACARLTIYTQDFVGITHPLATPRCNSGLPPARPGWPLQCGNKGRAPQCKRIGPTQLMIARSARFQRLEPPYLPGAGGGAAGSPFEPVPRLAVHVAG